MLSRNDQFNVPALQREVARLTATLTQAQQQYQELAKQAQQMAQQGEITDGGRIQALTQLLALLLEHHEGEVEISIPLMDELTKAPYQARSIVSADRLTLKLVATDGAGVPVQKHATSLLAEAAQSAALVQQKAAELEAENEVPRCQEPVCGRKLPFHTLDCPQNAAVSS